MEPPNEQSGVDKKLAILYENQRHHSWPPSRRLYGLVFSIFFMSSSFHSITERQQLLLDSAQAMTYKEIAGQPDLKIHFYLPKNLKEGGPRPAVLFFHSGAFDRGQPVQFAPHALYFVQRGAVCGLVNYRMKSTHPESTPINAIQDGLSALRFLKRHSEKLNVDPEKIVACGAGAGANIAGGVVLKTPIPEDVSWEKNPDMDVRVGAGVLLSPMIDIVKGGFGYQQFTDKTECKRASLSRHVKPGCPPVLVIHGNADRLVSCDEVEHFVKKMRRHRNTCEYVSLEGRENSFYNMNFDPVSFEICLREIDAFLVKEKFLAEREGDEPVRIISWREKDY